MYENKMVFPHRFKIKYNLNQNTISLGFLIREGVGVQQFKIAWTRSGLYYLQVSIYCKCIQLTLTSRYATVTRIVS